VKRLNIPVLQTLLVFHQSILRLKISVINILYQHPVACSYCDVHAAACFRGNKGGYLETTDGCFLGIRSKKGSSLPSVQRSYISDRAQWVSWGSWYPWKEEVNQQFRSNQDSVGKGCQKSGCGGYSGCRVSELVMSCKTEGVWRDSVVLYLSVRL
jgi:hypothetical protein